MGFFSSLDASASALTAQRLRMDIISENIANANITKTEDGTPYKRKTVLFEARNDDKPFSSYFDSSVNKLNQSAGVRVSKIVEDQTEGPKIYDPGHPDADEDGYVTGSNVNTVVEMVNMISASRSYEANITAMNTTKGMLTKTLELGSK